MPTYQNSDRVLPRGKGCTLSRAIPPQLYEREAREDRTYSDWAYDLLDEALPTFHKQPFVTVS